MNEHGFIKSVHRKINPDVHVWKICDTYTGGVPDAMYSGPKGVAFIEYKYVKELPKRDDTILRYSITVNQINWLERMQEACNAALVIGAEKSAIMLFNNFEQNISKIMYNKQKITIDSITDWIYTVTHSGREDDQKPAISGTKPP